MCSAFQTENRLFIELNENYTNNEPFHLGIAIDISGSMSSKATIMNENGNKVSTDLNYLDLVKHCIKVIIESLVNYENYILSLVVFNHTAYPIITSKLINNANKNDIFERIMKFKPDSTTNIWSAIILLNQIFNESNDNLPHKMVIFTDGISNLNPPRGIVFELKRWLFDKKKIPIHILGFGYHLDIKTLTDIAYITNGSFNYIPTTAEMQTVIVHLATRLIMEKYTDYKIIIKYNNIDMNTDINYIIKYLNEYNVSYYDKRTDYHNIISGTLDIHIEIG